MHFTGLFTILAAGVTLIAAQETQETSSTTTLTSTTTRLLTIVSCHPTVTDCPYHTTTAVEIVTPTAAEVPTTSSVYVPPPPSDTPCTFIEVVPSASLDTSSSVYHPVSNSTTYVKSTTKVSSTIVLETPGVGTSVEVVTASSTAPTSTGPVEVPLGAAGALVSQSGLLAAAVIAALVAVL